MGYKIWFDNHTKKHKVIVDKLLASGYKKEQIVDYFEYENMVKNEFYFCPLYAKDKKCHDIDKLNCYLCACPNFRFNDDGIKEIDSKMQYSFCAINSKDGEQSIYGEKIHQNCTACQIPHNRLYILKHFDIKWDAMMKECCLDKC